MKNIKFTKDHEEGANIETVIVVITIIAFVSIICFLVATRTGLWQ